MRVTKSTFEGEKGSSIAWYISMGDFKYIHKDGVVREGTGCIEDSFDIASYLGWYTSIAAANQAIINFYFIGVE